MGKDKSDKVSVTAQDMCTVVSEANFEQKLHLAIEVLNALESWKLACDFQITYYDDIKSFQKREDLVEVLPYKETQSRLVHIPQGWVFIDKAYIVRLSESLDDLSVHVLQEVEDKPPVGKIDNRVQQLIEAKITELGLKKLEYEKLARYISSIPRTKPRIVRLADMVFDQRAGKVEFSNNSRIEEDLKVSDAKQLEYYSLGKALFEIFTTWNPALQQDLKNPPADLTLRQLQDEEWIRKQIMQCYSSIPTTTIPNKTPANIDKAVKVISGVISGFAKQKMRLVGAREMLLKAMNVQPLQSTTLFGLGVPAERNKDWRVTETDGKKPRGRSRTPALRKKGASKTARSKSRSTSKPRRSRSSSRVARSITPAVLSTSASVCQNPRSGWGRFVEKWKALPLGYKILAGAAIAIGVAAVITGLVFCPPAVVVTLPIIGALTAPTILIAGGAIVTGVAVVAHTAHIASTDVPKEIAEGVGGKNKEQNGGSTYEVHQTSAIMRESRSPRIVPGEAPETDGEAEIVEVEPKPDPYEVAAASCSSASYSGNS